MSDKKGISGSQNSRMKEAVEISESGLVLKVYAQPGAKRTAIVGLHDQMIKIAIKEKALEGAANEALRKFLAATFNVSKSSITLIRGETSRQKVLAVSGDSTVLIELLQAHLPG
jgi:uncharacterized protein